VNDGLKAAVWARQAVAAAASASWRPASSEATVRRRVWSFPRSTSDSASWQWHGGGAAVMTRGAGGVLGTRDSGVDDQGTRGSGLRTTGDPD